MHFRFILSRLDNNNWTVRPLIIQEMAGKAQKPINLYFQGGKKDKISAEDEDDFFKPEQKLKIRPETKSTNPDVKIWKPSDKKPETKVRRKKKAESSIHNMAVKKVPTKKGTESREPESVLKQSSMKSHFQVRRSGRKPKSALKTERHDKFMQKILDQDESGLEVRVLPDKGRGVFAAKDFAKDELICEYAGELIDYSVGLEREREYATNPEFGCYSYFFQYKNKKYCVDATKESDRLGRLLNHCRTDNNVCTKVFPIKDVPRLILVASRSIKMGEELVYDYGERDRQAILSHPWLKS